MYLLLISLPAAELSMNGCNARNIGDNDAEPEPASLSWHQTFDLYVKESDKEAAYSIV